MTGQKTDVLVIGGGAGGVAAALAAARLGRRVILTEETDWLGGQFTVQAVPPDEHQWMEQFGGTRSYRTLREHVRDYYRNHYPLTPDARFDPDLRVGAALVTRINAEPRVWLAAMETMLAPYRAAGRVVCYLKHRPIAVAADGDRVRSVTLLDQDTGVSRTFEAPYVLDATELGDLLPLGGVEYVTGRESRAQTQEPHALESDPQPLSMQAITHVFAAAYLPGEDHTIEKPALYDEFRPGFRWNTQADGRYDPHLFPEPVTASFSQWQFRRVVYQGHFPPGFVLGETTLYNATNDYPEGPIIEVPAEAAARHRERARQRSLSVLYWLQTEAPHWKGGGAGYPGLSLRPDALGTADGLAKQPYVREARRIRAELTVLEQHVSAEVRDALAACGAPTRCAPTNSAPAATKPQGTVAFWHNWTTRGPLLRGYFDQFERENPGHGYGIPKDAKNVETAWAVTKYITYGDGACGFLTKDQGRFSPLKKCAETGARYGSWTVPSSRRMTGKKNGWYGRWRKRASSTSTPRPGWSPTVK